MKDYQERRLTEEHQTNNANKSCDMEVSFIMKEMSKTYAFMQMRPITPLVDGLQSCACIEQDAEETVQAVEALEVELQKNSNEKVLENQNKTMSAIKELEKELSQERSENDVESEIGEAEHFDRLINTVDSVADGVVHTETESNDKEIETELEGLERRTKKGKREEDKEEMENQNRRRKLNENAESDVVTKKRLRIWSRMRT